MNGQFFAIGQPQWGEACKLGLNPAVALLVLARGSGGDNITTAWSADAVARHAGISWRRAKAAIDALEGAKLASITKPGTRPVRKLAAPNDLKCMLWLPNTLVDGAGDEVPPVMRLRQAQNLEHLQAFIELYGMQDLGGDGGLPRSLVRAPFQRERICDIRQFTVWGFTRMDTRYCNHTGPLVRFVKREAGKDSAAWGFLLALEHMGLLQTVDYLTEGDSPDAELLHALTGDASANNVRDTAYAWFDGGPEWMGHRAAQYDYTLPVFRHIAAPAVVGVSRLVYRPHTRVTAAWWAQHCDACERFATIYKTLAGDTYQQSANLRLADIKAYQGASRLVNDGKS